MPEINGVLLTFNDNLVKLTCTRSPFTNLVDIEGVVVVVGLVVVVVVGVVVAVGVVVVVVVVVDVVV